MLSKLELQYTLALLRTPSLGDISIKKLIGKVGSAQAVFKERKSTLAKIDGIGLVRLKSFNPSRQLDEAEEEMRFIEDNKIDCYYFQDKHYPEKLKHCIDGPIILFGRGNIDLVGKRIISRSEEHTSELQSRPHLVCRLLLEKKKKK